jgi:hypothetical protein
MLTAGENVRTLGGARCGAPPPWRSVFGKRCWIPCVLSSEAGIGLEFEIGGARAVGGTYFKTLKAAPCCVYRSGVATDLLTWVRWARLGRGGRCMLFNGPYVHRSCTHGEAKPSAKTVGVAHSSYRPIPVLRFISTLIILWILLLSLETVGCDFFYCLIKIHG